MRQIMTLPAVVLLLTTPLLAANQQRYVAATGGTDSGNNCLSATSPCATLNRCVSMMQDGDTCNIGAGTYTNPSSVVTSTNCSASTPCAIRGAPGLASIFVLNQAPAADWIRIANSNWIVDGIYVRVNIGNLRVIHTTGSTGFTLSNSRIEHRPGVAANEVVWTQGTSNVTVKGNWVHRYPGCQNGGEPDGAGGNYGSCGSGNRCDFESAVNTGNMFFFEGKGTTSPTSNLVFEQNDYGHWRNPMQVTNFYNAVFRRNRCVNATNHGCFDNEDVQKILIENNVADIDTGPGCSDEILQSSLFDTYCSTDVTIRNNTVVGHGIGWEQQLDSLEPNPGAAAACGDAYLPNVGSDGTWYDFMRFYNNVIYDGKSSSGSAGIVFNSGASAASPPAAGPCCFSDYNLINLPSGGRVGSNNSTLYRTIADWRAAPDVDGDGQRWDVHSLVSAPEFVSYSGHNYRSSQATSPQVDAGVNTSTHPCPADDFDGNTRIGTGACDIGAFEYQAGGGQPTPPGTVPNVIRTDKH